MKRLLLGTLLLASGLIHAEGRWTVGSEGLAWFGICNSDLFYRVQHHENLALGMLASAGYERGPFVSRLSYLSLTTNGVETIGFFGPTIPHVYDYGRADLRLGGRFTLGYLTLGAGVKGRWMHFRRHIFDGSLGIDGAGMGVGLAAHLDLWGGLGLGLSADALGYYAKPVCSFAEVPSLVPMVGSDVEVYLQHHYEALSFAITLRAGLRGEGYMVDQFNSEDQEIVDALLFGGPFVGATLRF